MESAFQAVQNALPKLENRVIEFLAAGGELAKRGLLSPETWQWNRPRISLKTSIDVPMLGDIIEQNGDGLLEESHMPVGWPLHIDGAVRQRCIHRDTTLQELDDLLSEYDMKRDLAEINRKAPQWSHKAVWNKWYMEPKAGHTLSQMWINAEADITQKTSRSNEIWDSDLRSAAQMLHPDVRDDLPPSECAPASSEGQSSHAVTTNRAQPQTQFQ